MSDIGSEISKRIQGDESAPDNAQQVFRSLAEWDPTNHRRYAAWMLNTWLRGGFAFSELPRLSCALRMFDEASRITSRMTKGIEEFRDLAALENYMIAFENRRRGRNNQMDRPTWIKAFEECDVLYSGPLGTIVIPDTPFACRFWANGAEWPTAFSDKKFEKYNTRGPIYIITDASNPFDCRQLHVEMAELLDHEGTELELTDFRSHALFPIWQEKARDHLLRSPMACVSYSRHFAVSPELEEVIARDAEASYYYAEGERWEKGEAAMSTSAQFAAMYAQNLQRSFPQGEAAIAKDPTWSMYYAAAVLQDRFPDGEEAIALDAEAAYKYAVLVIRGRWTQGEKSILNSKHRDDYLEMLQEAQDRHGMSL